MLFSSDALLLKEVEKSVNEVDQINPSHELWSPVGDVDLPVVTRIYNQKKNILYLDSQNLKKSLVPFEYISSITRGHIIVECSALINSETIGYSSLSMMNEL